MTRKEFWYQPRSVLVFTKYGLLISGGGVRKPERTQHTISLALLAATRTIVIADSRLSCFARQTEHEHHVGHTSADHLQTPQLEVGADARSGTDGSLLH